VAAATSAASAASSAASAAVPSSSAASSGSDSAAAAITISSFKYAGTLTVKAGTKVTVTNNDSAAHTLTDKGGKFDTGNIAGSGGTGTFTAPTTPGSYPFGCTYHPNMAGTLVVIA
jgi:plastocyanin